MSAWYDRRVLPRVIGCACSMKPIARQRRLVVPLARGRVLELGVGGGFNLGLYDPARVERVCGVDPSPEMRARAEAVPAPVPVEVRDGSAESLPFEDASFDSVVCTFTLCSVASPPAAVAEARRVLKPGGSLLVCEHGRAPDRGVRRLQQRLEPAWSSLSGGCRLTRRPREALGGGGFDVRALDSRYVRHAPRFVGWITRGEARAA